LAASPDPERWVAVCSLDRLAERNIICVQVEGTALILVRDDDEIHAFERACPHEQADLSRGRVADGRLFCPRHQASFGLGDGAITPGWPSRDLRSYAVQVEERQVWVDAEAVKSAAS
jgi:3-phenylpropionate/trans-cinnamate dioxygenase ferredoxin subunit